MIKEAFALGYEYGLMKAAADLSSFWEQLYKQYGLTPEDYYALMGNQVSPDYGLASDYGFSPEAYYGVSPESYYGATPESYYGLSPEYYYGVSPEAYYGLSPADYYSLTPEEYAAQQEQLLGSTAKYPYQYIYSK